MKSFVQPGKTVTVTAPYDVASGHGCLVGLLFAVATSTAASGTDVEVMTEGVFDLVAEGAASGQDLTQGAAVYWDDTNKRCTKTATSNTKIGVALLAKASTATTVRVLLNESR